MTALFDEVQALRSELERVKGERDEARDDAYGWHRQCQTVATILGLPEPEGLGHAEAVRSKFEAAEARIAGLERAGNAVLASWDERMMAQKRSRPAMNLGSRTGRRPPLWSQAKLCPNFAPRSSQSLRRRNDEQLEPNIDGA